MKSVIKSILIPAFLTLGVFGSAIYISCNRDLCKTIVCANGGVCSLGSCTCPSGFEGTNCETQTRLKFTGNWSVFEKGTASLSAQYEVSIDTVGTFDAYTYVTIKNFNNIFKSPVLAYVSADQLIIPNQRQQGKLIYGIGTISSNVTYGQYGSISMRYLVQDSLTLIVDDYGYNAATDFSDPSAWNK